MKPAPQGEQAPGRPPETPVEKRRSFFSHVAAAVIGSLLFLVPAAAGLGPLLHPLRRRKKQSGDSFVRVANLEAVPNDGQPRQFPVIADRDDAWSRLPREAIGAVFLKREPGAEKVQAWTATCPHLGCLIAFQAHGRKFQCPCHTSAFEIDGAAIQPTPSPRDMDTLECEIRKAASGAEEIWVKFENFYTGREEKVVKV